MLGVPSHGWGTFQGTSDFLVEAQPTKLTRKPHASNMDINRNNFISSIQDAVPILGRGLLPVIQNVGHCQVSGHA